MKPDDAALIDDLRMVHHQVSSNTTIVRDGNSTAITRAIDRLQELIAPIPMRLRCPICGGLHVDQGEFATKPHHTHACQYCGEVWRPAIVPTVGVAFLPGFRDTEIELQR